MKPGKPAKKTAEKADGSQALSDIKCLVESISRIVLDIDGTPAAPNAAFDAVVTQAHTLLTGQPGHELANQSTFGQLATQASKIARNLGNIRNEFGGGVSLGAAVVGSYLGDRTARRTSNTYGGYPDAFGGRGWWAG